MSTLLAIFILRHAIFILCTAIAIVLWIVGGFGHVPWVTGLVGSVAVGSVVMLAKGPERRTNFMATITLMIAIDALLVLGLVKLGFTQAFLAWGIAHLAGMLTSALMMLGAQGAALRAESEDEVADWIASRGTVIGLGAAFATAMSGGH